MKKVNKAKIMLVEKFTPLPWRKRRGYKKIYVYLGNMAGAEKLPSDHIGFTDLLMGDYRAGQIIEWVYKKYVEEHETEVINNIFKDKRAYLIIKKEIMYELGKIFVSFILAEKFIKNFNIKEQIDFVPNEFSYTLYNILSERGDLVPAGINIPRWYLHKLRCKEIIRNRIYRLAFIFHPAFISLVMRLKRSKPDREKKHYKYAVHIWMGALTINFEKNRRIR